MHNAVTPSQVVAAIPTLTDVPLATREITGNPVDVEVAAQPLMQLVGELKTAQIELGACQQVSGLKDQQIVALKKKPKFFTRLKHVAEAVGVGVGIGLCVRGARSVDTERKSTQLAIKGLSMDWKLRIAAVVFGMDEEGEYVSGYRKNVPRLNALGTHRALPGNVRGCCVQSTRSCRQSR